MFLTNDNHTYDAIHLVHNECFILFTYYIMKITKEEIASMASTIQKVKLHLEDVSSSYEAEERLLALFEYIIWTFYKYYDKEEELDSIIDDITHILNTDDTSYMYDDLRSKEDVEKKEKKQRLWRDYMQKVMFLVSDYKRDLEQ